MGRLVAAMVGAVLLAACSTTGGGADQTGPAAYDIAEVRDRVEGPGVRCTDPEGDPSTVEPLPAPAATSSCDAEEVLLVISEYREGRDVVKLHEVACDYGLAGYPYLGAGLWRVEIEDDYGNDVDPEEVLGPLADRLGVDVEQLGCP